MGDAQDLEVGCPCWESSACCGQAWPGLDSMVPPCQGWPWWVPSFPVVLEPGHVLVLGLGALWMGAWFPGISHLLGVPCGVPKGLLPLGGCDTGCGKSQRGWGLW